MNGGDAIDGVTSHNAQVRHVYPPLSPLLDARHTTLSIIVSGPSLLHILHNTRQLNYYQQQAKLVIVL